MIFYLFNFTQQCVDIKEMKQKVQQKNFSSLYLSFFMHHIKKMMWVKEELATHITVNVNVFFYIQ